MIALSSLSDILTYCVSDESMPCEVCCGEGYAVATIEGKLRCGRCAERWHRVNAPRVEVERDYEVDYTREELELRDEFRRMGDDEYGQGGFRE